MNGNAGICANGSLTYMHIKKSDELGQYLFICCENLWGYTVNYCYAMEKGHTIEEFKPDSGPDVPAQPPVIGGVTQR